MALLQPLGTGQGYLKAGFLGFQKGGKTWTSTLLAIGTRELFGLEGPIGFFDTEGGSEYIAPLVQKATGKQMVGIKSRSFDDLCTLTDECLEAGVSVLMAESMTHIWRELCDAYLKDVNKRLEFWAKQNKRQFKPKRTLEFQDWSHVKGLWARWTDKYLNAPLHIIIAGRAGYEYDMEQNEETGKKELIKTGVKMKTEGEFGFEPSLLVEMERVQDETDEGFRLRRRATVLGDRFGVIDGRWCYDPTFEFFKPHVEMLKPGAFTPINTDVKSETGVDEDGADGWSIERRTRTILCEEIMGELVAKYPGQTGAEKKAKADLIHEVFRTRSWTAVEGMQSERLRDGLNALRKKLGTTVTAAPENGDASRDPAEIGLPADAGIIP